MKRYTVCVELNNDSTYLDYIEKIVRILPLESDDIIEFFIDSTKCEAITCRDISLLIKKEQELGKEIEFCFNNTLYCDYKELSSKMVQSIARYGINLSIAADEQTVKQSSCLSFIEKLKAYKINYCIQVNCKKNMDMLQTYSILFDYGIIFDIPMIERSALDLKGV